MRSPTVIRRRLQPPAETPRGWLPQRGERFSDATPCKLLVRIVKSGAAIGPFESTARKTHSPHVEYWFSRACDHPVDHPARDKFITLLHETAEYHEFLHARQVLEHNPPAENPAWRAELHAQRRRQELAQQAEMRARVKAARVKAANEKERLREVALRRAAIKAKREQATNWAQSTQRSPSL